MTTPLIRSANASVQERAIAVIVLAFATDPLTRAIYPDPQQYLRYFPEVIRLFCGKAFDHGTAYCVDGFAGTALWLPPGVHPREEDMNTLLRQSVPKENQEDVFAVLEQMSGYHPSEPHWYLPMIGVDPVAQGKGYGSALMRHALTACDGDNMPAYLETASPRNVPLYERHGFSLLGTIQIGSAPPVFPMLRRPKTR